jgi:hypothetical protein
VDTVKTLLNLAYPVALLACISVAQAGGDEKTKQAARAVLAKYQDAVACVKGTAVTTSQDGTKDDFEFDVIGTVLAEGGLTAFFWDSTAGQLGLKAGVEFKELRLILKDGREIPVDYIARDDKLELTFVAPKKRDIKLSWVTIEKSALPAVLDDVIALNRLSKMFDWEVEVTIHPISAVLKKQKTFTLATCPENGSPIFSRDGTALGLCVLRLPPFEVEISSAPSKGATLVLTHEALQPAIEKALKKWKDVEK